jgi:hypothetical protein
MLTAGRRAPDPHTASTGKPRHTAANQTSAMGVDMVFAVRLYKRVPPLPAGSDRTVRHYRVRWGESHDGGTCRQGGARR